MTPELELKVEPAFGFVYDSDQTVLSQIDGKTPVAKVVKKNFPGTDVSVYKDGRLILSPDDHYTLLQEFDSQIDRTADPQANAPDFLAIAQQLAQTVDPELQRVYHIANSDLEEEFLADFLEQNDYRGFELANIFGKNRFKHLFLYKGIETITFDDDKYDYEFHNVQPIEPELLQRFWHRPMTNRPVDTYAGNIFSVYFLDPNKLESEDTFRQQALATYNQYPQDSLPPFLTESYEAAIQSLSYGYKMRVLGNISEKSVKAEVERATSK